jgi:hypothetical protein
MKCNLCESCFFTDREDNYDCLYGGPFSGYEYVAFPYDNYPPKDYFEKMYGGSSNGRTPDLDSGNIGSMPVPPTI